MPFFPVFQHVNKCLHEKYSTLPRRLSTIVYLLCAIEVRSFSIFEQNREDALEVREQGVCGGVCKRSFAHQTSENHYACEQCSYQVSTQIGISKSRFRGKISREQIKQIAHILGGSRIVRGAQERHKEVVIRTGVVNQDAVEQTLSQLFWGSLHCLGNTIAIKSDHGLKESFLRPKVARDEGYVHSDVSGDISQVGGLIAIAGKTYPSGGKQSCSRFRCVARTNDLLRRRPLALWIERLLAVFVGHIAPNSREHRRSDDLLIVDKVFTVFNAC